MKIDRQKVYEKCGGRCGYCGREITLRQMQVDHIRPKLYFYHGFENTEHLSEFDRERFTVPNYELDDLRNLLPTCARCNQRKSSLTLGNFRKEIAAQVERLNKYSAQYRMALDFELIAETEKEVVFYFERNPATA